MFLFFIDGIGLGPDNDGNHIKKLFRTTLDGTPLVESTEPVFFPDGVIIPTDAVLGVDGIPQSATGQAAIFTGINTSRYLGYHLTAIPNEKLVELIKEKSLMKVLQNRGIIVTSANLYSKEFFKRRSSMRRNKFPVSTLTIQASGVSFRCVDEYMEGKAVFADITNRLIRERGYDIDLITPEKAGENLIRITAEAEFVFFEYFMTDIYGHKRNSEGLKESIEILSRFLEKVWKKMKEDGDAVLIVSDHGNSEDLTTPRHTLNKVPTILLTRDRELQQDSAARISSLADIYPWVLKYFGAESCSGR